MSKHPLLRYRTAGGDIGAQQWRLWTRMALIASWVALPVGMYCGLYLLVIALGAPGSWSGIIISVLGLAGGLMVCGIACARLWSMPDVVLAHGLYDGGGAQSAAGHGASPANDAASAFDRAVA